MLYSVSDILFSLVCIAISYVSLDGVKSFMASDLSRFNTLAFIKLRIVLLAMAIIVDDAFTHSLTDSIMPRFDAFAP